MCTEKATDEKNMGENWETVLDVCDRVKAYTSGPRDCLKAIFRRLNHQNPHVAKQAVIVSSQSLLWFQKHIISCIQTNILILGRNPTPRAT